VSVSLLADSGTRAFHFTEDGALLAIGSDRIPHRWPAKELELSPSQ
jgi:hypothetical protein